MGSAKCEKARHWNIPVVSVKWVTDIILGDLSCLKLPVSSCYTNITGDENFSVDLTKVSYLLGMSINLQGCGAGVLRLLDTTFSEIAGCAGWGGMTISSARLIVAVVLWHFILCPLSFDPLDQVHCSLYFCVDVARPCNHSCKTMAVRAVRRPSQ